MYMKRWSYAYVRNLSTYVWCRLGVCVCVCVLVCMRVCAVVVRHIAAGGWMCGRGRWVAVLVSVYIYKMQCAMGMFIIMQKYSSEIV